MDDLIQRLRNPAWTLNDGYQNLEPTLTVLDMEAAANEIEHLRAEIILLREASKFKEIKIECWSGGGGGGGGGQPGSSSNG